MSELRKSTADKAKETLTPDSSKSGLDKAKESATDTLDNAASKVQGGSDEGKGYVQQAKDAVNNALGK